MCSSLLQSDGCWMLAWSIDMSGRCMKMNKTCEYMKTKLIDWMRLQFNILQLKNTRSSAVPLLAETETHSFTTKYARRTLLVQVGRSTAPHITLTRKQNALMMTMRKMMLLMTPIISDNVQPRSVMLYQQSRSEATDKDWQSPKSRRPNFDEGTPPERTGHRLRKN